MDGINVGWNLLFQKGKHYNYYKESSTLVPIYWVSDGYIENPTSAIPFTETKFYELFDNKQEDRENKLNKIL